MHLTPQTSITWLNNQIGTSHMQPLIWHFINKKAEQNIIQMITILEKRILFEIWVFLKIAWLTIMDLH